MIIKHFQQDIIISLSNKVKYIGLNISGGTDSAILGYILCNFIYKERPDVSIIPITNQAYIKRYNFKFSSLILSFLKKEFPTINFECHIKNQNKQNDDYDKTQKKQLNALIRNSIVDIIFSGTTSNPPIDICNTFLNKSGNIEERITERDRLYNNKLKKTKSRYFVDPFQNLDKKGIYQLYVQFELLNTLLPLTRSCEAIDSNICNNFTNVGCKLPL